MSHTFATRRRLLLALAALPVAATAQSPQKVFVEVWKDAGCGCCGDWVKHLQDNGFTVKANDGGNEQMRAKLGMPAQFASCHTALVGGYAVEGHVPAREIRRLLAERPRAVGLSVPGMPVGTPGMDDPAYGGRKDPYDVLLVRKDGRSQVFASYHKVSASPQQAAEGPMAEGEVRKVDVANGKITLKHGEIRNLDMPPMTMVFTVRDKALLANVRAGDKVRFAAQQVGAQYFVTAIERR